MRKQKLSLLTPDERRELEELRHYRKQHEGKALHRSFSRLEQLLDSQSDPMISIRAFRVLADCLIALKDELKKDE